MSFVDLVDLVDFGVFRLWEELAVGLISVMLLVVVTGMLSDFPSMTSIVLLSVRFLVVKLSNSSCADVRGASRERRW